MCCAGRLPTIDALLCATWDTNNPPPLRMLVVAYPRPCTELLVQYMDQLGNPLGAHREQVSTLADFRALQTVMDVGQYDRILFEPPRHPCSIACLPNLWVLSSQISQPNCVEEPCHSPH